MKQEIKKRTVDLIQKKVQQKFNINKSGSQRVTLNKIWEEKNIFNATTQLALQKNAINLGQGSASFKIPEILLENISYNILNPCSIHSYIRNEGNKKLCQVLSEQYSETLNYKINENNEILILPGAQAGLQYCCSAFCDPGDEVILIEPFYKMYQFNIELASAIPVGIKLIFNQQLQQFELDYEALEKAVKSPKAKLLILNSPHNPSGKVFNRQEQQRIANIVQMNDQLIVLSDEVYEKVIFDNNTQISFASINNEMKERTLSLFSAGKTFSMTGLRLGWLIGPQHLINLVNKIHTNTIFCVYDPLQNAIADTLITINQQHNYYEFNNYYEWLRQQFQINRDNLVMAFNETNMNVSFIKPQGGFFGILDIQHFNIPNEFYQEGQFHDVAFCNWMIETLKIAAIPLSSFYLYPSQQNSYYVRIALCKDIQQTLQACQIILNA